MLNKNIFIYGALLLISFSSCRKDSDPAFEQSADARLNETLSKYQDQLTGSTTGWKAVIEPAGGGNFGFYLQFNASNRVVMYSDFNPETAAISAESSYRLKALQQPSLIFDTYSYIHLLADPNESTSDIQNNVNGGPVGQGLKSDFEFYFDTATNDTIHLIGRFNGSKATLIRATQEEAARYNNGGLSNSALFNNIASYLQYFLRVTMGGIEYEIKVNTVNRSITFSWLDGSGVLQIFKTSYSFTLDGLQLASPLPNGMQTITSFTDFTWNASALSLGFKANGAATIVTGTNKPIKTDPAASRNWWLQSYDAETYYSSYNGFHVNGVDDAYGITKIADYYALSYWAYYGDVSGTEVDFEGYITIRNDSLQINFASVYSPPTFTADGRIIFNEWGTYGDIPAEATSAVEQTNAQMSEPNGYYIIQTSDNTYDMVSAKDGKAWITWVWEP